ncbi:MAG: hypothetical protein JO282_03975 [Alphaproteobacteria bacterium]|nr:hypothetical protein [Alphaproteobacteria bacterium]
MPDAAAQKLLPEGWQVSPPSTGSSKDANLTVIFIDELAVQNPDGTPGELFRIAGIGVPAKKKGTDATVGMVGPGLVSNPSYAPGPYGTAAAANATVDRHVHTDAAGKSTVEESWEFKGDGGDAIQLQLQYISGVPVRSKGEVTPHSAVKPDFYRIYRFEQAADVVRSSATGTDRTLKYLFKATGPKLSLLFDGSEQLISITSLPFYSRQIFLPEEVTQ